jgi:RHS repeat-associated protein
MISALLCGPRSAGAKVLSIPPLSEAVTATMPVVGGTCPPGATGNSVVQTSGNSSDFAKKSPGLVASPTFNTGSSTMTVWGLGWTSESDQFIWLASNYTATWVDGTGLQRTFYNLTPSSPTPSYAPPISSFVTLTAVTLSSGAPTVLREGDKEGTTLLFSVFESTRILRLSLLTDKNGNTVTYTRDAQGRLTKVTDIHGRFFNINYNAQGFVSQLADSGGRTSNYSYDAQGHMTSLAGPLGTTAYQYDSSNRMTKITYPNGGVHNYTYDAQGRILTENDGGGNDALSYSYYASSTVVTDALSRATLYRYTTRQGLKKLASLTDAAGGVTSYIYDASYNLASQTDPLGHVTQYQYDANGNTTLTQDPANGLTRSAYDPTFNLPTSLTDPLNHTTSLTYDPKGDLTAIQDPLTHVAQKSYDSMGHVTLDQDPLNEITRYTYDQTGTLASTVDPLSRTTNLTNDALSRVLKNTDPANHATNYQYDQASDLTQVTDAAGNVTQYTYSPGRDAKVMTQVKDALGHTTTFGYDDLGRLTSVTNALGQTKTSAHDAKGNLIQTRNARGQVTTYTYDSNDRLIKKTMVEGNITYAYDAAGNMTQASHYNGSSLQNTYDANNRLTQQIQTLPSGYGATLGYAYDAAGNRTRMTTPWGTFNYAYDAANRLTSITNPQSQTFTFAYDAAGRRTQLTYPNGIVTSYSYDNASQLLSITATRIADQVVASSISYTYDSAGNRTSMTDWAGAHAYGYDAINRLVSAAHPAATNLPVLTESFSYDALGNRLADAQLTGYTYDVANRLKQNSGFTYGFDTDGNLAVRTDTSTHQTSFGYDSANEQVAATMPQGANWSYSYDASGRRVGKSSGTASGQQFVYAVSGELLATLDSSNNPSFIYTSESRLGTPLAALRGDGSQFFYHADALSSVVAHTDQGGYPLDSIEYTAYGQAAIQSEQGAILARPASGDHLSHLGLEFDPETRTRRFGPRYFDPAIGQFTSEDPIGIQGGINLLGYASESPINKSDPSGLAAGPGTTTSPSIEALSPAPFALLNILHPLPAPNICPTSTNPRPQGRRGTLSRCLDACATGPGGVARTDFCNSLPAASRPACFQQLFNSETECRGYCFGAFGSQ